MNIMKLIRIDVEQEEILFIKNGIVENSQGGIYNSSYFELNGNKYIISRVEKNNELERNEKHTQHRPVIFELNDDFTIKQNIDLAFKYDGDINEQLTELKVKLNGFQNYRTEDYRVFKWNNELWSNHTLIIGKIRPVISKINLQTNQLEHKKIKVFRLLNRVEKNWLFFEHKSKLKFIYSINPFIIMSSDNGYDFKKESFKRIKFLDKKYYLSGSTNPVTYDDENYIFFIHYRDEYKVYCHHLVLMNKETLEPIFISENPIFRQAETKGIKNGVLYLVSHIKTTNGDWIFSFGEGDLYTKIVRIKHEELSNQLTN
jgi:predicted GH43/DUF377 family glycosyl hydrolase